LKPKDRRGETSGGLSLQRGKCVTGTHPDALPFFATRARPSAFFNAADAKEDAGAGHHLRT